MSNLIRFKQPTRSVSFRKLLWGGVLCSFAVSAGVTHLVDGYDEVAQASGSRNQIVTAHRGNTAERVSAPASKTRVIYGRCAGSVRVNCIVDGDTLWSNGIKIRIADIDTPEVSQPRCAAEKAMGDRATARLIELVNSGPFHMQAWPERDEDKYGRKLRVLTRNGRSLGDILVSEGLARTWTGRRQPWC